MRARLTGWLPLAPVALLVAVALHQIWLTRSEALSPWSGGGFGMFSSTDAGGRRHLHAFALHPGIRRELAIPATLREPVQRTLAFPSDAALRRLADLLADPDPVFGMPRAIEIQVWRTRFDPETLAPEGALLRGIEVFVGSD